MRKMLKGQVDDLPFLQMDLQREAARNDPSSRASCPGSRFEQTLEACGEMDPGDKRRDDVDRN